ncbi:sorbosone dehydrogenase [candidate division KSB1 bacterium]|nr:sorbosone dehydrogenase [candidate division KSB1 bacterium]
MMNGVCRFYNAILVCLLVVVSAFSQPVDTLLTLPSGFQSVVFAEAVGRARHLTVRSNGDVYVALRKAKNGKGVVALRDSDGDHVADQISYFGDFVGTGIEIYHNHIYFGADTAVVRYALMDDALLPNPSPEVIIAGLPDQRQHRAKPLAFDDQGNLYLNIGAPSNACQEELRTPGSPGMDPCPQLQRQGTIWVFSAEKPNQTLQQDGKRYISGIRHCVAVAWNPLTGLLYGVQHGRDQLHSLWPDYYTEQDNAGLPAEEFLLFRRGSEYGWPYCYYDSRQDKKVLAPEYGGDGNKIGRCDQYEDPIMTFPAHWAPNDLHFYTGNQFPPRYRGGAFIAFHGSWNRAPEPQRGYKVMFVPFNGELPTGEKEIFADGFSGNSPIFSPREAKYRPMGLAESPDGSLYISDSTQGKIWKVIY